MSTPDFLPEPTAQDPSTSEQDPSMSAQVPEPRPEELATFWTRAKTRAKLAVAPGYMAQNEDTFLEPPAFALGDGTVALADSLARLVLDGVKTATSSYLPAYEAEGIEPPHKGDLSILLDGEAHPVALLRNREVRVLPFAEVDEAIAAAEGSDLNSWRDAHREIFTADMRASGGEFSESGAVVVEVFDVLYRAGDDLPPV